jgi:3-oxoacyl-[acyl-carrier-protein] synthase II
MTRRRVVVTGLGATTPLGGDVATTWAGLLAGKSGVRSLTEDWAQTIPVTFAARVAVEPSEQMERVEIRRLDRSEQFGLIASREAWKDAGSPEIDKERLGVVVASGIGGVTTLLEQYDILNGKGARLVSPHTVPMLMPNGPAANIGLELQAQAGVHTPVSACASGAEAIGYAFEMIRNNRADIVVSGGVEAACHALPMAAFAAMKALSTRNDDPARASRPYDLNRDGFVLGEGGGILVLEEYEHAKARGAKIYCEIAGQGLSSDGFHIAAPDPSGAGVQRAVRFALRDADLTTALGKDADHVAVSATKSMTGHLLGGAGAIESVFIVKALQDRMAPPTINIDDLDPAVTVDVVRDKPRALPAGDIAALNDSFGFGGHNVVLAFKSL